MNFKEIDKLKKNTNDDLFDITQSVFIFRENIRTFLHVVEKEEEMRMDLISQRLYNTTDYVVYLCRLNNIINPLNIKEGTILIYVTESDIQTFSPPDDTFVEEVKQTFVNLNKKRRVDSNREDFNSKQNDENVNLPPVFNETDVDNISIDEEGIITIGPGSI